jgi:sterol desaturase/sphingolipid hydroxylase (fatty acid hydroxylase superfamily)
MQEYSIRHFSYDVLDAIIRMSKTRANYWAEFVVDGLLGIVLIIEGLRRHDQSPVAVLFTILLGLFIFSFMEYVCHRWLFHGSIRPLKQGHTLHHGNPLGYDSLPFFLPALVLMGLTWIFVICIPASHAYLLSGSIAFGYITYGLSHYLIHHKRFRHPLLRNWAAHHHIHHHHQGFNFGVTTPLWDVMLGTRYARKRQEQQ